MNLDDAIITIVALTLAYFLGELRGRLVAGRAHLADLRESSKRMDDIIRDLRPVANLERAALDWAESTRLMPPNGDDEALGHLMEQAQSVYNAAITTATATGESE